MATWLVRRVARLTWSLKNCTKTLLGQMRLSMAVIVVPGRTRIRLHAFTSANLIICFLLRLNEFSRTLRQHYIAVFRNGWPGSVRVDLGALL
jgi:hypothetical protein